MSSRTGFVRGLGVGLLASLALVASYIVVAPESTSAQGAGGLGNVLLLCSSCTIGDMMENHIVLMNTQTGAIWAYSETNMLGVGRPLSLGSLKTIGEPITYKKD